MKYLFPILIIFFSSCGKEECQIPGGYEFVIPATLTPARDTFRVGDTLTIESVFPDQLYERRTNAFYHLEDFRFFPGTEIKKIDESPAVDGMPGFDLVVSDTFNYLVKMFSDGQMRLRGDYVYNNEYYKLQFRLIARRKGLYYLEQTVDPGLDSHQDFEGKCSNVELDGAMNLNEGADNHIGLLQESPDSHYSEWISLKPEDRFYKFGGYCFYVKE